MSDTVRDSIYRDVISFDRARDPLSPIVSSPLEPPYIAPSPHFRSYCLGVEQKLHRRRLTRYGSTYFHRRLRNAAERCSHCSCPEKKARSYRAKLRHTLAKFATDRLLRETYEISDLSTMLDSRAKAQRKDARNYLQLSYINNLLDGKRERRHDRRPKVIRSC